jgi:aminoglycoside phosphotransferase (APT) family kinase protein
MADTADPSAIVTESVRLAYGGGEREVAGLKMLAGGARHQWWSATVPGATPPEIVVRMSPAQREDALRARNEFHILKAMHQRGVHVPMPVFVGENSTGQTFTLLERVDGDTNPRQLVTSDEYAGARRQLLLDLAKSVATIHTVAPSDVPEAQLRAAPAGEDPLLYEIGAQLAEYDRVKMNPHPLIEWALRWARREAERLPRREGAAMVVHGDLRIGNIMYDSRGLSAILDWEGVHVGEPEEDLSWFCTKVWRFNRPDLEAGGLASREEWFQAYEAASGRKLDRERVRVWEVLQNARWAIICMMQSKEHLEGWIDSHEHGAIGRRAADTELEVLRLAGELG